METKQKKTPNKLSRLVQKLRGKSQASSSAGAAILQHHGSCPNHGQSGAPPSYDDVVRACDVAAEESPDDRQQNKQELHGGGRLDVFSSAQRAAATVEQRPRSDSQTGSNGHQPAESSFIRGAVSVSDHKKPKNAIWANVKPSSAKSPRRDTGAAEDDHLPPSNSVTHVGSDGSISYYEQPKGQTTPGFEWASSSSGYDWESRKVHYGNDNPTMGEAYQRQLRQRELTREENLVKAKAIREEGIRIAANERWVAHKA